MSYGQTEQSQVFVSAADLLERVALRAAPQGLVVSVKNTFLQFDDDVEEESNNDHYMAPPRRRRARSVGECQARECAQAAVQPPADRIVQYLPNKDDSFGRSDQSTQDEPINEEWSYHESEEEQDPVKDDIRDLQRTRPSGICVEPPAPEPFPSGYESCSPPASAGANVEAMHVPRCVPPRATANAPSSAKSNASLAFAPKKVNLLNKFGRHAGPVTTLMIRNVPCRFTQDQLMEIINAKGFEGKYDFFYMPSGNRPLKVSAANFGYGFINFTEVDDCEKFHAVFHNGRLEGSSSLKTLDIQPAHIQGLHNNVRHFQHSLVARTQHKPYIRPGMGYRNNSRFVTPPTNTKNEIASHQSNSDDWTGVTSGTFSL